MAGIPTVVVEMANPDGSSGWVNVSSYVDLKRGIRCGRGRSNEFETSAPGTASFTVINKDGDWAPGGGFSDVGYGLMQKNARVRFTVAGVQVWRGRVDSIKINAAESASESSLEISCTDEFKTYAKAKLAPYAVETCKVAASWTGGAVYPLSGGGEQARTGTYALFGLAGDASYLAAHRDASATRAYMRIGTATDLRRYEFTQDGPPHIKGALKLSPVATIGPVLVHPTTWNPGADYGLVSLWFRTTAQEDAYLFEMRRDSGGTGYVSILLNGATGRLTFSVAGDSGGSAGLTPTTHENLWDGSWHHVAAWFHTGSGTTIRAYIDGVLQSTATSGGTACTIGSSTRKATFGGRRNTAWTTNSYVLNGDIACPAIWLNSATTDQPANWYADGMNGNAYQTVANRLTKLASFVGVSAPSTANLSGYYVTGQDTDGKSYLDAVQALASTEMGQFYIDRLGDPKLRGYGARDSGASVTLTVSATQDLTRDASLILDDATYANTVRATSEAGSVLAQDSTLVTADGAEIVDEWSSLTYTESELATMADNRLDMRKSNAFRLGRISVDLLTTPNSIASTTLQLVPLDRVSVTSLDADIFGATTFDGFVEGWELNVSTDQYAVNLDLSPVI
jgi:hypothetical protein